MEKFLSSLLIHIQYINCIGSVEVFIGNISTHSARIEPNTLFIAQKGEKNDGHDFFESVIHQGATIIVCERIPDTISKEITYIQVVDTHIAEGLIGAWFYDFPANKLQLIGITGTNGKTTVASLIWQALRLLGQKTGLISTIAIWIDTQEFPNEHTTPFGLVLQKLFNDMVNAGCGYVVMEVSSHAIVQNRISGLSFEIGIFTNLSQDHLDFHGSMENYALAKKAFFTGLPAVAHAITNYDDYYGKSMISDSVAKKSMYGMNASADYYAENISISDSGTMFDVEGEKITSTLMGCFNLSNSLASYATLRELKYKKEEIAAIFPKLVSPSGRFEIIAGHEKRIGIVDFAHTPDGLKKLLTTINRLRKKNAATIVVFGCGGDRDKSKRPIMGRIVAEHSDHAIITSDNPRFESPEVICSAIADGIKDATKTFEIIVDRKTAIIHAVDISKPGDVIVVAGKGHEQFQDFGNKKVPFSDQKELRAAFESTV